MGKGLRRIAMSKRFQPSCRRKAGLGHDVYDVMSSGFRRVKGGIGMANIVTSVLGDYRGYDTMGETVVIFTAALCVLMLLRDLPPRRRREDA